MQASVLGSAEGVRFHGEERGLEHELELELERLTQDQVDGNVVPLIFGMLGTC